jgi:hypothetical protein
MSGLERNVDPHCSEGHRDLRSACSKAAVATLGSTGSYVASLSSKWVPVIDQLRVPVGGSFRATKQICRRGSVNLSLNFLRPFYIADRGSEEV